MHCPLFWLLEGAKGQGALAGVLARVLWDTPGRLGVLHSTPALSHPTPPGNEGYEIKGSAHSRPVKWKQEGSARGPPGFPSTTSLGPQSVCPPAVWNLLLPQSLGERGWKVGGGHETSQSGTLGLWPRFHLISRSAGSRLPGALKELTRNSSPLWFLWSKP